jgi:hypothetical protein
VASGYTVNEAASSQHTLRADRFSYVALDGIWAVFTVIFTLFAVFRDPQAWKIALPCFALTACIRIVIRAFELTIEGDKISYRTLFRGTRSPLRSEIMRARVEIKVLTNRSGVPLYALILEPYPETGKPPLNINMKVFRRGDLRILFEFLGDKLDQSRHKMDRVLRTRKRQA